MIGRSRLPLGLAGGLTALALTTAATGCTDSGGKSDSGRSGKTAAATSSPSGQRPEAVAGESVTRAPQLPDGKVLAQNASVTGNRTINLPVGMAEAPLAIAVNCQGEGTLTVTVRPVAISFPLKCVEGEVSSTYNVIDLKRPRTEGSVQVKAPSTVRWSLTVGQ